jgi:DNA ligase (NAD+)
MARINSTTDELTVIEVMEIDGEPLKGMTFCITGHLAKPRKDVEALIEQAGGRCVGTITYGTTYLVSNGDWTPGSVKGNLSSKHIKAQKIGVPIISERKLLEMLVKGSRS